MNTRANEAVRPTYPVIFPVLVLFAVVMLMVMTSSFSPVVVCPLLWLCGDLSRKRRLAAVGQMVTLVAMGGWLAISIWGLASIPAYGQIP